MACACVNTICFRALQPSLFKVEQMDECWRRYKKFAPSLRRYKDSGCMCSHKGADIYWWVVPELQGAAVPPQNVHQEALGVFASQWREYGLIFPYAFLIRGLITYSALLNKFDKRLKMIHRAICDPTQEWLSVPATKELKITCVSRSVASTYVRMKLISM